MESSPHTFVAAASLTPAAFKSQFPLVTVASLDLLPESVLTESKLNGDIVKTVLQTEVLPELVKWQRIFRSGNNRPILRSVLPVLRALSPGIGGTHAGVVFDDAHATSSLRDSAGSSRGLSFVNEDGDQWPLRQTADFVAYVLDKKLYEENGHIERLAQVCKLVIEEGPSLLECWIEGPRGGCFQLGACMLHHGIQGYHDHDFVSGRRSPICGVALSLNQWAAAELRIEGVVTIKAGRIEKHNVSLMDALDRVRKTMKQLQISDGIHLVGSFYFQQHPFSGCSWNPPTTPVYRLIESLLRICVGDRILHWGVQEVKQKLSAYQKAIADEVSICMNNGEVWS